MSTYMSVKDSLESDSARKNLYPTPYALADLLFEGIDWLYIHDVLEPSAGTGALARCVAEKLYTKRRRYPPYDDRSWREAIEDASIDCIEIDPTLRNTLEGAGYRVVHDDFLTFQTFKRYDLIVMNPPFDRGAEHLLKALSIQSRGGRVCCILNAETIRNPYNSTRQELAKRLAQYDTSIRFKQGAFEDGERTTDVEVALVSGSIPRADISDDIMENMRKAPSYEEPSIPDAAAEIIRYNAIDEWVSRFNFEVACGIRLIEEWQKMRPHILEDVHDNAYSRPIITIKVKRTDGGDGDACLNDYIRQTRMKYWAAIFKQPIFTRKLTQNLLNELNDSVRSLADYDFSYEDMDREEQHVVDSFQGREAYEHIMAHADYFLDTAQGAGLFLGAGDLP